MKSYIDRLDNLDVVFDNNLVVDLVFVSFPSAYDNFSMNYHLDSMDKKLMKLYNLLQKFEVGVKKVHVAPQT